MRIGKWEILIRKIFDGEYSDFFNVKLAKRYIKRHNFTLEKYWGNRISCIKKLRQAHFNKYGVYSGLKVTKEFLDTVFDVPLNFDKCQGCIYESKNDRFSKCYCLRKGDLISYIEAFLCNQKETSNMGLLEVNDGNY